MTIEDKDIVDFIGIDKENGSVGLLISDHLPWDQHKPSFLKDKVNAYLDYIESGGLTQALPEAEGRQVYIELVHHFPPNEIGVKILMKIKEVVEQSKVSFSWSQFIEEQVEVPEQPEQDKPDEA